MIPALVVATALAADPELYAIIVGHNGGPATQELPTLRFADDDALRFHRWFSGFTPQDHLWLLADPDDTTRATLGDSGPAMLPPTRTALLQAIDALKEKSKGRHARVFFVYAGHGLPGRFLLQPESSDEAAFTGRELRAAFSSLDAETAVLFLDACRSQSLFAERGGSDFSAEVRALERSADQSPLGILTAASSTQSAGEAVSLGGGYFSHVLASGLAGAADADADGTVRFGELAAFVAFHTERLFGQRPWFEAPGGDLRAPVIELKSQPGFTFEPELSGRLRVRDLKSGAVVAELNKAPGRPLALALPEGRYRVERSADAAEIDSARPRPVLASSAFTAAAVASRGAEELDGFQSPFSTDVVNALSAGYQSGAQPARAGAWTHAIDLAYALDVVPYGVVAAEHGLNLGYRRGLGRFYLGVTGAFHNAQFGTIALRRAGAMLEGGLRFAVSAIELEPLVGAGMTAVWLSSPGVTRADFTVPYFTFGLRLEVPLGYGLAIALGARGELTFPALDRVRTPFLWPLLTLGVSWKS